MKGIFRVQNSWTKYLEPKVKGVNRARVHPEVELRSFFEDLLGKIKEIPRVSSDRFISIFLLKFFSIEIWWLMYVPQE